MGNDVFAFSDRDLVCLALSMYGNYLETGDPICSAADYSQMGNADKIKFLSVEQMRLRVRLSDMDTRIRKTGKVDA